MLVKVIVIACFIAFANGRAAWRGRIPNGYSVPNPCGTSTVWDPVGHFNPFHHTHYKNSFGNDFRSNGYNWDATLCHMDSDKDGKSNGEELGDPNCVWTQGGIPEGSAIGHPGICEPVGSSTCSWQNFGCDCLEHCNGISGFP